MFLNSSLSGRLMVHVPADESTSLPKIIISLSTSIVSEMKSACQSSLRANDVGRFS